MLAFPIVTIKNITSTKQTDQMLQN
uniref:Uncharacterized protein n=1 Tax=Rhizophora mucronata TaxID=61149 RepID=A0A2P2R3X1_RHIMU